MHFWRMSKEMMRIRVYWMQPEYQGAITACRDIDPKNPAPIPKVNELYPTRTLRASLPKECKQCFLASSVEWEKVKAELKKYDRVINETPMNGNCCYKACLQQTSHPDNYDEDDLRRHCSYFLAKYPEVIEPHIREGLEGQTVKSWIINQFEGRMYGDIIALTCISLMWNVAITVITPHMPPMHLFHSKKAKPDIVLVHNGRTGAQGHFTSTGMFQFYVITISAK